MDAIRSLPEPDGHPALLVRPSPLSDESPQGYALRLAEANFMTLKMLRDMGYSFTENWLIQHQLLLDVSDRKLRAHVKRVAHLLREKDRVWNLNRPRFCPACLAEDPYWRASWEILFHDVCPHHGVWLIDLCGACHQALMWRRSSLIYCQCGADLRREVPRMAPASLRQLSEVLEAKLLRRAKRDIASPLAELTLEQTLRLIRYMGTHMDPQSGPAPLQLSNLALLQVSWRVSSLAAEILTRWPEALHESINKIQDLSLDPSTSLQDLLHQTYSYIYVGFHEPAFRPVQIAFESWIIECWKGGVCNRNRRLAEPLLAQAMWIPGNAAAARLRVSNARLCSLIREEQLQAQESISPKGRHFITVCQDNLDQVAAQLANEITMDEAMKRLGISKVRLRKILPLLFPDARRIDESENMPWRVPRDEVDQLVTLTDELIGKNNPNQSQISMWHVFKYWAWGPEEVVSLIQAVKSRTLKPVARLIEAKGVASWIFHSDQLKAWHASLTTHHNAGLSITETAVLLGVKQHTGYWLARNGYLAILETSSTVIRAGLRVRELDIERFKEQYIFGSEIAKLIGRSPRKTAELLSKQGIPPILGNALDPCPKLIYVSNDATRQFIAKATASGLKLGLNLSGQVKRAQH